MNAASRANGNGSGSTVATGSDQILPWLTATPEECLGFEVSQLVDGTLEPGRRAALLARIDADPQLAALRDDFRLLDEQLHASPSAEAWDLDGLAENVMQVVRLDAELEGDTGPLRIAEHPAVARPGANRWRLSGWMPAAAAAALLLSGIGIGVVTVLSTRPAGDSTPLADGRGGPSVVEPGEPYLLVAGPEVRDGGLARADAPGSVDGAGETVFRVSGPDRTAVFSTEPFAGVAGLGSGYDELLISTGIVHDPGRVGIASAE